MLLVTHFHLDHCAAVPHLLAHTPFKGRVFMTHSTKAIYHMLLADFCRLNKSGGAEEALFTEEDLAGARVHTPRGAVQCAPAATRGGGGRSRRC